MTGKYKILAKYIKDLSSETPNVETYLFVKDQIAKYQLGIDINSIALKNNMVEVNTTFKFEDKEQNKKKSYFELVYSTIIKPTNARPCAETYFSILSTFFNYNLGPFSKWLGNLLDC